MKIILLILRWIWIFHATYTGYLKLKIFANKNSNLNSLNGVSIRKLYKALLKNQIKDENLKSLLKKYLPQKYFNNYNFCVSNYYVDKSISFLNM